MRRQITLLTASMLLAAPAAIGVAHAAVPPNSFLTIYSGDKKVTSTSGKTLHVSFEAEQDVISGAKTTSLREYIGTAPAGEGNMGELHQFLFSLPNSDVTFDKSTGKATISTGTDVAPYGTVDMTFKPSSSTTSCKTQTFSEKGALSGAFHLDTNAAAWGKVGSNSFSFGSGDSGLTKFVDKGFSCGGMGSFTPRCFKGITWYGPGSETGSISGSSTGSGGTISMGRTVNLGTPSGASRVDSLDGPVSAAALSNGVLTIHSGGRFSGTATIDNGTKSVGQPFTCKKNGTKYQETVTSWNGADWTSPSSNLLTAHFQITPDLQAPQSDLGLSSYSKNTFA